MIGRQRIKSIVVSCILKGLIMRVSSTAFRLFLTGCLAATDARFERFAFVSTSRVIRSHPPPRKVPLGGLHEQNGSAGNWWEKIFNVDYSSTPESRRSLGIEDSDDEDHWVTQTKAEEEALKDAAEIPFFSEDTGTMIPGWTPPQPKPPKAAPPELAPVAESMTMEEEEAKEVGPVVQDTETVEVEAVEVEPKEAPPEFAPVAESMTLKEEEEREDENIDEEAETVEVEAVEEEIVAQETVVATAEPQVAEEEPPIQLKAPEPPVLVAKLQDRLNEPFLTPEQTEEVTQVAMAVVDKVVVSEHINGIPLSAHDNVSHA